MALHYWMGDVTSLLRAPVTEMTYTVSSGTLNSTIPYHAQPTYVVILGYCWTFDIVYIIVMNDAIHTPHTQLAICMSVSDLVIHTADPQPNPYCIILPSSYWWQLLLPLSTNKKQYRYSDAMFKFANAVSVVPGGCDVLTLLQHQFMWQLYAGLATFTHMRF